MQTSPRQLLFDKTANFWERFYRFNNYYHKDLQKLARVLIPANESVIEFGCREGELLGSLPNKKKKGVEASTILIEKARKKFPSLLFETCDYDSFSKKIDSDYILLSNVFPYHRVVQYFTNKLRQYSKKETRIIVVYFNFLWKPFLDLAEKLKLRLPQPLEPNWLEDEDISNIFYLGKFDEVKKGNRFIFPYKIPLLSDFLNRFVSQLPIINTFCLTRYSVFRILPKEEEYSVSIIIPARNEAGNIPDILSRIPKMGKDTEVIFVEGGSLDNTYEAIKKEVNEYRGPLRTYYYKQQGKGKKEAVFLGFSKAKNDILMILDADFTVNACELQKFYDALANGSAEFANGSRLVYPMEKQAMRFLNYIANKLLSISFSYIFGRKIKDTLCGTKVLFRKDFLRIRQYSLGIEKYDQFGDFDLLFGASKLNLKIVDIPIRYHPRTYGKSNISRLAHGWLFFKMTILGAFKLRFV